MLDPYGNAAVQTTPLGSTPGAAMRAHGHARTTPSCRSTATASACAPTAPASPRSAPASTTPTNVGNSHDRAREILAIVDKRRHSGYT